MILSPEHVLADAKRYRRHHVNHACPLIMHFDDLVRVLDAELKKKPPGDGGKERRDGPTGGVSAGELMGCTITQKQQVTTRVMVMSEWVSIKDQLPPSSGEVLVYEAGVFDLVEMSGYINDCLSGDTYDPCYDAITHWMPLPEPPK